MFCFIRDYLVFPLEEVMVVMFADPLGFGFDLLMHGYLYTKG